MPWPQSARRSAGRLRRAPGVVADRGGPDPRGSHRGGSGDPPWRGLRRRLPDVSAETLPALRERRDETGAARARLEGASASVAIHAEQDLELDGERLADLFPGSEVWLGEDLDLAGLRGSDVEEPFGDLSGGAREQLSLLVRIGLAEVLGTEQSWPLVLDDALVNTDPERIRRVQRLLCQASRRMQILLLTCSPAHLPRCPVRRAGAGSAGGADCASPLLRGRCETSDAYCVPYVRQGVSLCLASAEARS